MGFGCLSELGFWGFGVWLFGVLRWGSPSGPSLPLALTPGPSPAERERGVDHSRRVLSWRIGGLVFVLARLVGAFWGLVISFRFLGSWVCASAEDFRQRLGRVWDESVTDRLWPTRLSHGFRPSPE